MLALTAVFDGSWKHITSQVRESEEKRRKRKENIYQHSISDSSIGANRHKFRYSFKQSYEDLPGIINSGAQGLIRLRFSLIHTVTLNHNEEIENQSINGKYQCNYNVIYLLVKWHGILQVKL